jgi:hypothetical protein
MKGYFAGGLFPARFIDTLEEYRLNRRELSVSHPSIIGSTLE